ncbi:MAG TPA: catalase-related domain-containing protein, partial [Umezawaea sp.]|nr:catalase-related domain-containing protein [Umezawaea sp.]
DPVYAPNSYGGPHADAVAAGEVTTNYGVEDAPVRAAYKLHVEDDDFGQAGTMVREVFTQEQRDRLVETVIGHAGNGVSERVLERVFEYWRNIDKETGDRIAAGFGK